MFTVGSMGEINKMYRIDVTTGKIRDLYTIKEGR